jgi:hypothetical protein
MHVTSPGNQAAMGTVSSRPSVIVAVELDARQGMKRAGFQHAEVGSVAASNPQEQAAIRSDRQFGGMFDTRQKVP